MERNFVKGEEDILLRVTTTSHKIHLFYVFQVLNPKRKQPFAIQAFLFT